MPNKHTKDKTGFPCKPEDCHVSRHLDGPDYKIYDLMMAATEGGKNQFYGSVKWLCNAANQGRSTVDATLDRLEAAGWIVNKGRTRRSDGTETPNTYDMVKHPEWVKTHAGQCPDYKFAPDQETAERFGVNKGDVLKTGSAPFNFFEHKMRKANFKLPGAEAIAEVLSGLTVEEQQALRTWFQDASPGTPGEVETSPGTPTSPGQPGEVASPGQPDNQSRSTGNASPGTPEMPVPVHREESQGVLSQGNLSLNTHHTPRHGDTSTVRGNPLAEQRVGVCVEEKPSASVDPDSEVDALLEEFMRQNDGEPGNLSSKERDKLFGLASKNGRDKFRGAARAWLKAHPWNTKTTNPFLSLINGFAGYAKTQVHANKMAQDRAAKDAATERALKWASAKQLFSHMEEWDEGRFWKTLTPEQQQTVQQVCRAQTWAEMPAEQLRKELADLWMQFLDKPKPELESPLL